MNNIIDFREVSLPVIYGSNGKASVFDYIAYIRKQYPNPWETCYIIENDHFLGDNLLSSYNLKSISEADVLSICNDKASIVHTLEQVFFVITYEMLQKDLNDYGLNAMLQNFMMQYSVSQVQVLVYLQKEDGEDVRHILYTLRESYPSGYLKDNQQIILPYFAYTYNVGNELSPNLLDISKYVDEIIRLFDNETLTIQKIDEFESYIEKAIKDNDQIDSIVYFGVGGHIVLRAIVAYLSIKYNLSYGISEDSKYNWITECGFTYLYNRMSLYERLYFVNKLPVALLYKPNMLLSVDCRYRGYIAPDVIATYDFDTCEEIDKEFTFSDIILENAIDFRTLFKEQNAVASTTLQSSQFQQYPDYTTDLNLIDKFMRMDQSKNINIRNSLLYNDPITGRLLLVYTEGDFILDTQVAAVGIFKSEPFQIEEKNFNKLFTHPVMSKLTGQVPLVMDIKSILILNIFSSRPLYLSYYELALRWVRSLEDNVYDGDVVDLFSYIPLDIIRNEPNAKYFITSFGKPISFDKNIKENIKLRVTNKILSGKVLPK